MGGFTEIPPKMDSVVITYDGGGLVAEYKKAAMLYRLQGREVKIAGVCRSACLYALSVPKVCVFPGAIVSAHYVTDIDKGLPRERETEMMLQDLPKRVADVLRPYIEKKFTRGATLTADQMVKLGIKRCNGKDPVFHNGPRNTLIIDR
jgi:hypothetical protein